jgi:hypothetical protein
MIDSFFSFQLNLKEVKDYYCFNNGGKKILLRNLMGKIS